MISKIKDANIVNVKEGNNPLWSEGLLFNFLVTAEETQGKVTVLEAVQRKGYEPPVHIHPEADEIIHVIAGEMTFYVAGQTIAAPAGTSVVINRGQEHNFTVETETANTLITFTPGISKNAFKELSAPALKLDTSANGSSN